MRTWPAMCPHCVAVGDRAVLIRLQNNIKLRAIQDGDLVRAAEILHTMVLIAQPVQGKARIEVAKQPSPQRSDPSRM